MLITIAVTASVARRATAARIMIARFVGSFFAVFFWNGEAFMKFEGFTLLFATGAT